MHIYVYSSLSATAKIKKETFSLLEYWQPKVLSMLNHVENLVRRRKMLLVSFHCGRASLTWLPRLGSAWSRIFLVQSNLVVSKSKGPDESTRLIQGKVFISFDFFLNFELRDIGVNLHQFYIDGTKELPRLN